MLSAFITCGAASGHVPYQTTHTLEATIDSSFRTASTIRLIRQQDQNIETDLSHNGLNPAHVPF